jgi:alkanesulfonate monooxygenase SsuD/methylene tetrahydromethanopterin reductase-like flavin-dependent oxidoreductase (luciferase family)
MEKLGLGIWPNMQVRDAIRASREAEKVGFDSVWVVESSLNPGKDAISYLGALSVSTDKIRLGSGVINLFSRSATLIASTMATLDEISGGRIILGIGTGHSVINEYHSVKFSDPVQRMREYVEVIRMLVNGERVSYDGRDVRVEGLKLNLNPIRCRIPIYIATVSEQLARLAGEIGDGVIFVLNSASRIGYLVEATLEGARRAGKPASDIEISCYLPTFMMNDVEEATDAAKRTVANYGRSKFYRRLYGRMGYKAEAELLAESWKKGDSKRALDSVGEKMAKDLTIVGSESECLKRVEDYRRAGITLPIIQPCYVKNEIDSNVMKCINVFSVFRD